MGCGCKKKTCNICCGNVASATPLQPFCGPVNSCPEDHCQEIITQQFVAALKVVNSWNVPDCGGSATLYVQGLVAVAIGSYLWNSQYGYFEIVGFDADTHQVTVTNPCIDGNAPEGTQVPACTYFIVTDEPIAAGSGSPSIFPFVAVDFTAPLDGDCLLITVTNVNGLVVGKNVQIGSGMYRVESIPDGTHIVICNDGFGITPGTAVIAKNAANQFVYPIILIDANPCTNDGIASGCLVACKDDILSPLGIAASMLAGMVPTVMEDGECDVEWKLLEVPTKTCTTITCCLTLVTGQANYIISVADSSQFTVGDVLQIGTRTDRFTVTAIPDATHLQGTLDPVPGAITDIDPGTSICIVDCCELIEIYLESEDFRCGDFQNSIVYAEDGVTSANEIITLDDADEEATSAVGIESITNVSECREMFGIYIVETYCFGNANDANTNELSLELQTCVDLVTNPPPPVLGGATNIYAVDDNDTQFTLKQAFHAPFGPIAGGGVMNIVHMAKLIRKSPSSTGTSNFKIDPEALQSRLVAFGVGV